MDAAGLRWLGGGAGGQLDDFPLAGLPAQPPFGAVALLTESEARAFMIRMQVTPHDSLD